MNIDTIIRQISNKLESGIVLFTGAGFSKDAKDLNGNNLPLGPDLAKEIWSIPFPSDVYDGSKLSDVYHAARRTQETKLIQYIKSRLTIDSFTLPSWYELYLNFPWEKIYTLNLDNLWKIAASKFGAT